MPQKPLWMDKIGQISIQVFAYNAATQTLLLLGFSKFSKTFHGQILKFFRENSEFGRQYFKIFFSKSYKQVKNEIRL